MGEGLEELKTLCSNAVPDDVVSSETPEAVEVEYVNGQIEPSLSDRRLCIDAQFAPSRHTALPPQISRVKLNTSARFGPVFPGRSGSFFTLYLYKKAKSCILVLYETKGKLP